MVGLVDLPKDAFAKESRGEDGSELPTLPEL